VLPTFKSEKLGLYNRILTQIQVVEITNAHQIAAFWNKCLAIPQVKAAAAF
jgi:hypothetical protein